MAPVAGAAARSPQQQALDTHYPRGLRGANPICQIAVASADLSWGGFGRIDRAATEILTQPYIPSISDRVKPISDRRKFVAQTALSASGCNGRLAFAAYRDAMQRLKDAYVIVQDAEVGFNERARVATGYHAEYVFNPETGSYNLIDTSHLDVTLDRNKEMLEQILSAKRYVFEQAKQAYVDAMHREKLGEEGVGLDKFFADYDVAARGYEYEVGQLTARGLNLQSLADARKALFEDALYDTYIEQAPKRRRPNRSDALHLQAREHAQVEWEHYLAVRTYLTTGAGRFATKGARDELLYEATSSLKEAFDPRNETTGLRAQLERAHPAEFANYRNDLHAHSAALPEAEFNEKLIALLRNPDVIAIPPKFARRLTPDQQGIAEILFEAKAQGKLDAEFYESLFAGGKGLTQGLSKLFYEGRHFIRNLFGNTDRDNLIDAFAKMMRPASTPWFSADPYAAQGYTADSAIFRGVASLGAALGTPAPAADRSALLLSDIKANLEGHSFDAVLHHARNPHTTLATYHPHFERAVELLRDRIYPKLQDLSSLEAQFPNLERSGWFRNPYYRIGNNYAEAQEKLDEKIHLIYRKKVDLLSTDRRALLALDLTNPHVREDIMVIIRNLQDVLNSIPTRGAAGTHALLRNMNGIKAQIERNIEAAERALHTSVGAAIAVGPLHAIANQADDAARRASGYRTEVEASNASVQATLAALALNPGHIQSAAIVALCGQATAARGQATTAIAQARIAADAARTDVHANAGAVPAHLVNANREADNAERFTNNAVDAAAQAARLLA